MAAIRYIPIVGLLGISLAAGAPYAKVVCEKASGLADYRCGDIEGAPAGAVQFLTATSSGADLSTPLTITKAVTGEEIRAARPEQLKFKVFQIVRSGAKRVDDV